MDQIRRLGVMIPGLAHRSRVHDGFRFQVEGLVWKIDR
jgi:hypothetical protein